MIVSTQSPQTSPFASIQAFCAMLRDELASATLCESEAANLRRYYRRLLSRDGALDPLGVYGYASRLLPLVEIVRGTRGPLTVLDCGCGYGTESLLLGVSGAAVTGIEAVPDRVAVARARIPFYERRAKRSLDVRYANANVLRFLEGATPVDVVWALEAISHIHPLEDFLALALDRLKPGGFLITSDPNALNPLARYRAFRTRGTHRLRTRVKAFEPDGLTPVVEAVERIFPVRGYLRQVRRAGFEVTRVDTSGFLAASLLPERWHRNAGLYGVATGIQRTMQRMPVLRRAGMNFTVVARKPGATPIEGP